MTAQQNGLFLLIAMATIAAESQSLKESQRHTTTKETHFCYNSSLERFRLNATILEVRDVSSKQECVDECLDEPCCRSINYEYSTSPSYIPNKCEFLHDLLDENTSSVLIKNTSFDHAYIIEPHKAYNDGCFPKFSETQFLSCKDVFEKNSSASNGFYRLQSNETNESYQAICMNYNAAYCGGGVWTLVVRLDGDKDTFQYNSSYWTNNETLYPKNNTSDAKLASYHYTPFNRICLGMKIGGDTHSIVFNYTASSLYSVIAGGSHSQTDVGRAKWMSLVNNDVNNASPQGFCNKEGFNINATDSGQQLKIRIGRVGYNAAACGMSNLNWFVGFGVETQGEKWNHRGSIGIFPDKIANTSTTGLIFVQ